MNILMLNYEFPPIGGGGGQAHQNLLRQYAGRADLQVDVLTSAPQPGLVMETPAPNITIYKVGIRKKDLQFWRRTEVLAWLAKAAAVYRRLLRENHYDLAHAFFAFPTGWLCHRQCDRLPYMISLRGSDVPGQHGRLKLDYKILAPLMRAIWRNADGLVACSEGLRTRALRFMPEAAIDVIPNGVDLERFQPAAEQEATCGPATAAAQGPLRLVTVGRLSVTKRVDMLIEVVERLVDMGLDVRLTVVGGGRLLKELKDDVEWALLDDRVLFTGAVAAEQMPLIYRNHDLFISASMQEGMSNAMLEAMASGLPIVTTRCEGVDELIGDNGVVVEEADPDALAAAIQSVAEPQVRQRMGRAARERAERFSWAGAAEQYIAFYRRILDARTRDA